MKVLVTGPDGLLGSNLVRELISRDYKVFAFVEKNKESKTISELNLQMIEGNILEQRDVLSATEGIHCYSLRGNDKYVSSENGDGEQGKHPRD